MERETSGMEVGPGVLWPSRKTSSHFSFITVSLCISRSAHPTSFRMPSHTGIIDMSESTTARAHRGDHCSYAPSRSRRRSSSRESRENLEPIYFPQIPFRCCSKPHLSPARCSSERNHDTRVENQARPSDCTRTHTNSCLGAVPSSQIFSLN